MSSVTASGVSNNVALLAATATAIGGVNLNRAQITVTSNDGSQIIYLYWGTAASVPTATVVKTKGTPLLSQGSSVAFAATLRPNGSGSTDPTLYGVAGTSDQSSPNDTRWAETS